MSDVGYTQPICGRCWDILHPDRNPSVVIEDEWRQCCLCGQHSLSGIYIRIDPKMVAYPQSL